MYLIDLGPVTYGPKDRDGFTLVEAMREVYGTGQAAITRLDGTLVVASAGSASAIQYVPRNRRIYRRPVRHLTAA